MGLIGRFNRLLHCRLASAPSSAESTASAVCAILEADAEALQEANGGQEIISINLVSAEHYCSPVLWKACTSLHPPLDPHFAYVHLTEHMLAAAISGHRCSLTSTRRHLALNFLATLHCNDTVLCRKVTYRQGDCSCVHNATIYSCGRGPSELCQISI